MRTRASFGKNVKPTKVYINGLEDLPGKTVGLVLSRHSCMALAQNLIGAVRTTDKVDVTLFFKAKTPVVSVTPATKLSSNG